MKFILFSIAIFLAVIESWFQPWLAVVGVPLPLVLAYLAIIQAKIDRRVLPWLGLTAGLAIDLSSSNYFGANMFYYLAVSWAITLPLHRIDHKKQVWVRAGMVMLAALLQPWYLLLVNRQFEIEIFQATIAISIFRAGSVGVLSLIPLWLLGRRDTTSL